MYVLPQPKMAFLANPRTGSRSTKEALAPLGFKMMVDHHAGFADAGISSGRYVTFSTVRNHFDCLVSWDHHIGGKNRLPDIDELLHLVDVHRALIRGWPPRRLFPYAHVSDHVLRFEHLPRDLNGVLEQYGLGPVQVPHVGRSDRGDDHWRELFTPEMIEAVVDVYGKEMRAFGYWPPLL